MKTYYAKAALLTVTVAMFAGCASPRYTPTAQSYPAASSYPYPTQSPSTQSPGYYSNYGVVDSIRATQAQGDSGMGIGVGTVVGGVVGGVLGNQVGGGRGKKVATVAGVVGGAMVGNEIERRNSTQGRDVYQVGVRMDNGSYQTITQDNISELQIGSRVRIENNRVYRTY